MLELVQKVQPTLLIFVEGHTVPYPVKLAVKVDAQVFTVLHELTLHTPNGQRGERRP